MTTAQPKTSWPCASLTTTLVYPPQSVSSSHPVPVSHLILVKLTWIAPVGMLTQQQYWVENCFIAKQTTHCGAHVLVCHSALIRSVTATSLQCALCDGTFFAHANRKLWVVSATPLHRTLYQHLSALRFAVITSHMSKTCTISSFANCTETCDSKEE